MKTLGLLSLLFLIVACKNEVSSIQVSELIGYQTIYVGEPGPNPDKRLEQKIVKNEIKIKKHKDYILVSTWEDVNACGNYIPNLKINNDTIILDVKNISEELCMSASYIKVNYFFNYNLDKSWVFVKKSN